MSRWLIYALGGGLGHLVRGLALARAAVRTGVDVRLLTNSPFAGLVPLADELDSESVVIDADAERDEVAARVRAELDHRDFDLLVVDTFPRGLAGELAGLDIGTPRALVHRDLSPTYVEQFDLRAVVRTYDLVLLPGERGPLADDSAVETAPWLIRDADELASPEDARTELGVTDESPLVCVVASGKAEEIAAAEERVRQLAEHLGNRAHVRFLSVLKIGSCPPFWPLIRLLPGVDLLVGSGGYNTVYEARATGTPLLAIPQQRLYDRQDQRLRAEESIDAAELNERVAAVRRKPTTPRFENGVHAAVRALRSL